MSSTPESRVKAKVDAILHQVGICWYFKPVQSGYGKRALDYVCCIGGCFVAIETKAEGEVLTRHQRLTAIEMLNAGGKVWIISDEASVEAFRHWVLSL